MNYVHGTTAKDQLEDESISDSNIHQVLLILYDQLATIAAQLLQLSFNKVDSICLDHMNNHFQIDSDYETG